METRPLHAPTHVATFSFVSVLSVVHVGQVAAAAAPGEPSLGVDHAGHGALHEHHAREWPPWPTEVGLHAGGAEEVVVGAHVAVLEREAGGGLCRRAAGLRRDGVLLAREREPGEDGAALEDGGGVAEDEVDGAGDAALAVELPAALGVQRVLVPPHLAEVHDGAVRGGPERHRLVVLRPGRVLDRQLTSHEAIAFNTCMHV
uniref:Uncharacterized protein n=1 Tax=Oryza brachyantha TaxID=4533 RepID=J3MZR6_ORYBR